MPLPKVTENNFKERLGVCAVELKLTELRFVWRETRNTDVGIDGQIEYVDENGACTGHVIAAQVKSGKSYFKKIDSNFIYFKPDEKHKNYWANFPLPVILFLHDHEKNETFWIDARRYLRNKYKKDDKYILIPIENRLTIASRPQFLDALGTSEDPLISSKNLLREMSKINYEANGKTISFLEMFGLSFTDVANKLFFSMSTFINIYEDKKISPVMVFGQKEYDFIDSYVSFLISQNLIYYDLSDYLLDWVDREIVPVFLAPLTPRGQEAACSLCEIRPGIFHERQVDIDLKFYPPQFDQIEEIIKDLQSGKSSA